MEGNIQVLLSNFGEIAGLPNTIQELASSRDVHSLYSNSSHNWANSNISITDRPVKNIFPEGFDDLSLENSLEENVGEGRFLGGGGCNDAFSVFAFLTFVLSLLDIIMQLQMGGKRKRRSGTDDFSVNFDRRDAMIASHSLARGFTNAMTVDTQNENSCIERFLCEGWHEASKRNSTGKSFSKMAMPSAKKWLLQVRNSDLSTKCYEAMKTGILFSNESNHVKSRCSQAYPDCMSIPRGYRFPGIGDPQSKLLSDAFREHKVEAYRVMSHFVNLADKMFDFEKFRLDMN